MTRSSFKCAKGIWNVHIIIKMVNSNRGKPEQRNDIKIEYCLALGSDYLNRQSATFFISATIKHSKNKLQALKQAQQRVTPPQSAITNAENESEDGTE